MNPRSPRRTAARPQPRTGQDNRGRPGNPGRPGARRPLPPGPLYTPGAGGTRQSVERRSARTVLLLHQLPKWLLPVLMAGLLVAGLAVRGPGGGAALVGVAAILGWLGYLSWPALGNQGRLLRAVTVLAVLALAVWQVRR